jgi:hypothetical protein
MSDRRILEDDCAERHLSPRHFSEGDVLRSLRYAVDLPGILLRKESLWDHDEKVDGQREKREENPERDQAKLER